MLPPNLIGTPVSPQNFPQMDSSPLVQHLTNLSLTPDEKESYLLDLINTFVESDTIRNLPNPDLNILAHIFGDKWIRDSKLEGGLINKNLSFIIPILYALLTECGQSEDLQRLINDFEGLNEWCEKIDSSFDSIKLNPGVQTIRRNLLLELQTKIRSLNIGDRFLIPATWKTDNESHAVIYKFELNASGYSFTIYNSGYGIENHPVETKGFSSPRYATHLTKKGVSSETLSSIGFLSTLIYRPYFSGTHPNNAADIIYKFLIPLLGGEYESDLEILNVPQTAGTCSMGCLKAVIYHCLEPKTLKYTRFKMKFLALAKAYSNFKESGCPLSLDEMILLKAGRNSLGRAVIKLKQRSPEQKSDHDLILAYALMKCVDLLLEKPLRPALVNPPSLASFTQEVFDNVGTIDQIPDEKESSAIYNTLLDPLLTTSEAEKKEIVPNPLLHSQVDLSSPERFVDSLSVCFKTLFSSYSNYYRIENNLDYMKCDYAFYQIMNQIPLPSTEDNYYDDPQFTPELLAKLRPLLSETIIFFADIICRNKGLKDEVHPPGSKNLLPFFVDMLPELYHIYAVLTVVIKKEIAAAIPDSTNHYAFRDGFFSDLYGNQFNQLPIPALSATQNAKIDKLRKYFASIDSENKSEVLCFNYNHAFEEKNDEYRESYNTFFRFSFMDNLHEFADANLLRELFPRGSVKGELLYKEYENTASHPCPSKFLEYLYVTHYPPFLQSLRSSIGVFRTIFTELDDYDSLIHTADKDYESQKKKNYFAVQASDSNMEFDPVELGPDTLKEDLSIYAMKFRMQVYSSLYLSSKEQENPTIDAFETVLLSLLVTNTINLTENEILTRSGEARITENFGHIIPSDIADMILQKVQEFIYAKELCFNLALEYYQKEITLLNDVVEGKYHRFILQMLFFRLKDLRSQLVRNGALIKQMIQFFEKMTHIYGVDTTANTIHCFFFDILNQIRQTCEDQLLKKNSKHWNALENIGLAQIGLLSPYQVSNALGMRILNFYDQMKRPWTDEEIIHILKICFDKQNTSLTHISIFKKLEKIWPTLINTHEILNRCLASRGEPLQNWKGDFPTFTSDQQWTIDLLEIRISHPLRRPDSDYAQLPHFIFADLKKNRSKFKPSEDGTLYREISPDCLLVINHDITFKLIRRGQDYHFAENFNFLRHQEKRLSNIPQKSSTYCFISKSTDKVESLLFSIDQNSCLKLESHTLFDKTSTIITTENEQFQWVPNELLTTSQENELKKYFNINEIDQLSLFIDPHSKRAKRILINETYWRGILANKFSVKFVVEENKIIPDHYPHLELLNKNEDFIPPFRPSSNYHFLKDKKNNFYLWILYPTANSTIDPKLYRSQLLGTNNKYISDSNKDILIRFDPTTGKILDFGKDSIFILLKILIISGELEEALNIINHYATQVDEVEFFKFITLDILTKNSRKNNPADIGFRVCCLGLALTFQNFKIFEYQQNDVDWSNKIHREIKDLYSAYHLRNLEIPLTLRPNIAYLRAIWLYLTSKQQSSQRAERVPVPLEKKKDSPIKQFEPSNPIFKEQIELWKKWNGNEQINFYLQTQHSGDLEEDDYWEKSTISGDELWIIQNPFDGDVENRIDAAIFNHPFIETQIDEFIFENLPLLIKSACSTNSEMIFQMKFLMNRIVFEKSTFSQFTGINSEMMEKYEKIIKLILMLTSHLPIHLKSSLQSNSTDESINEKLNKMLAVLRANPTEVEIIFSGLSRDCTDSGRKAEPPVTSPKFLSHLSPASSIRKFFSYTPIPLDLLETRKSVSRIHFYQTIISQDAFLERSTLQLDRSALISQKISTAPLAMRQLETIQKSIQEYHQNPDFKSLLYPCSPATLINLIKQFQNVHDQLIIELSNRIHSFKNDLEISHWPVFEKSIQSVIIHKNGEDFLKDIAIMLLTTDQKKQGTVFAELGQTPERLQRALELLVIAIERDHLKNSINALEQILIKYQNNHEDYSKEQLAEISNYLSSVLLNQRCFEPQEYPQGVAFEYLSGIFLREGQYQKLRGLSFKESKVIELMMGEGKTAIINPALALMASGNGYFPFMIVPPNLLQQSLVDLGNLIGEECRRPIMKFVFSRGNQLTLAQAQKLLDSFESHFNGKGLVLTTPASLQEFLLKYQEMVFVTETKLELMDSQQKDAFIKTKDIFKSILRMIKQFGVALADEAHWVFRPLQEVNFTLGEVQKLPSLNRELSVFFHTCLADHGYDFDQSPYSSSQKGSWSDMETILAKAFIEKYCDVSDEDFKENLFRYLLCRDNKENRFIEKINAQSPAKADLYAQASMQIIQFLPHTLSLIFGVEFGNSRKPENKFAVPYSGKDSPSENGEFGHIDIMLNLTSRKYFLTGLSPDEFKSWILFVKDNLIKAISKDAFDTNNHKARMEFCQKYALDFDPCTIDTQNIPVINDLCNIHGKETKLINRYLSDWLFPKFTEEVEKLSSTPSDIGDLLFNSVISTSGSPYNSPAFPLPLSETTEKVNIDTGRLISRLLEDKNSLCATLGDRDLKTNFMEHIRHLSNERNVRAIIDLGAFFRGISNQNIAKQLLTNIPHARAILFFDDQTQEKMALQRNQDTPVSANFISLPPSDYVVYYDQKHFFGAHFELDQTAHGIVSIHRGAPAFQILQAFKRLRGLETTQTISTVISESFAIELNQHHASETIQTRELLLYGILQESRLVKKEIMASVPKKMMHQIRKALFLSHLESQRALNRDLFVTKQLKRPYQLYGLKTGKVNSVELIDQLKTHYQSQIAWSFPRPHSTITDAIEKIAESSKAHLPSEINGMLNLEMDQEVEKQKEVQIEIEQSKTSLSTKFIKKETELTLDLLFHESVYPITDFLQPNKKYGLYSANDVVETFLGYITEPLFHPNLFMSENFLKTTQLDSISPHIPIKKAHFLVEVRIKEEENLNFRFIILSLQEIRTLISMRKVDLHGHFGSPENIQFGLGIYTMDNFSVMQLGTSAPELKQQRKEVLAQIQLFNTEHTVKKEVLEWIAHLPIHHKQNYHDLMSKMEPARKSRQLLVAGNVIENLFVPPSDQQIIQEEFKRHQLDAGNQPAKRVKIENTDFMDVNEALDLWGF